MRRDCVLTFTDQQILAFFEWTLDKICTCVQDILRRENIANIVLVGGYGSSSVLGDRIRSTFGEEHQVIVPDSSVRPQAAIVHGAAYFGLYTSVIESRISEKTYGIKVSKLWFDGCGFSESESEWDPELSERRVHYVFKSMVKRGTRIKPGETFKSQGHRPIYPGKKQIRLRVFQSNLRSPRLTTKDCEELGDLVVPLLSDDDKFDVHFTFGAELRVEIIRGDGDRHFATIDIG